MRLPIGNQVIDLESAKHLLAGLSPDLLWMLSQIESSDGAFRFPPLMARAIENLKIDNYPLLYESELAIGLIFLRGVLSEDELRDLADEWTGLTAEERGNLLIDLTSGIDGQLSEASIPKTPAEERLAAERFNKLSAEEKSQATKVAQHYLSSFLASFHQVLSSMVHGQKLTDLIARAKSGDDAALVKAVQIDKRILTSLPYARARFERASALDDRDFLDALSYRLRCAPYKGKIRHKSLWFAFAFLDMCGLLDSLKHRELLDLLEEVGLGGYPNRIEDVKHLSKRLADYRAFQGGSLSTP